MASQNFDGQFLVEKVCSHRPSDSDPKRTVLNIKWDGYGSDENTNETFEQMMKDIPDQVLSYCDSKSLAPKLLKSGYYKLMAKPKKEVKAQLPQKRGRPFKQEVTSTCMKTTSALSSVTVSEKDSTNKKLQQNGHVLSTSSSVFSSPKKK